MQSSQRIDADETRYAKSKDAVTFFRWKQEAR